MREQEINKQRNEQRCREEWRMEETNKKAKRKEQETNHLEEEGNKDE